MLSRILQALAISWIAANLYVWYAMSLPEHTKAPLFGWHREQLWHQLYRPYVWSSEGR